MIEANVRYQNIFYDFQLSSQKQKRKKVRFSSDQDKIIKELAEQDPPLKWKDIAEKIPGKTSKQCRERYQHFLAPNLSRSPWTISDDAYLLQMFHQYGSDWATIAKFFPGRTNNDVKNRFNGHLKHRQLDVFLSYMMNK